MFLANVNMLQAQNSNTVGAIPGVIDVSPTGAATYTIPIEVVPGTQNMQPDLSIVYNSMDGMGLLGMKWDLEGLSAITRCGQNHYYDNNITAIQFNNNDRFEMDGDRLLRLNGGAYGDIGGEYAIEMENFTRVVSYGGTAGSPDHFKAYTDDGSIIEYGNTFDSKQLMPFTGGTLSWLINKITDANGNYMTFHYTQYYQDDGEIWIYEIQYTGNTGMQPYAKVQFGYTSLPDTLGRNTYYVSGNNIPQSILLQTITATYNNTVVRKYKFNYNKSDLGERTAHLKEVMLYGEGGDDYLNSTAIMWGDKSTNFEEKTTYFPNSITLGKVKVLSGDFNGDGFTDLLVYENKPSYYPLQGWQVFLYDHLWNDFTEDLSSSDNTTVFKALYAQDINGDGKDELIIQTPQNEFKILSLPSKTQIGSTITINNFHDISFGDFDGNGSVDIAFTTLQSNLCNVIIKKVENNTILDMGAIQKNVPNWGLWDLGKVIDANGNGKKNIIVDDQIYEYNGSSFQSIFNHNWFTDGIPYSIHYGDFNGDGITDIIAYGFHSGISGLVWKIFISRGNGYYDEYVLDSDALDRSRGDNGTTIPLYDIIVTDINGDGKSDIVQMINYGYPIYVSKFNILLSKGWVNWQYLYNKKEIAVPVAGTACLPWADVSYGDYNGDGKIDLIVSLKDNGNIGRMYCYKDNEYEFVKEIKDGIGKKIEINYFNQCFIAQSPYWSSSFPTRYKKYSLPVIESLKISNGLESGMNIFEYQYNNAFYSLPRRSFLGFDKFICINYQDNEKDSCYFLVNSGKQILLPARQISYFSNQKTREKLFTVEFKNLPSNRFAFNYNVIKDYDWLSNSLSIINKSLNNAGRLMQRNTKTYNSCSDPAGSWLHSDTKNYTFNTITLNGYQKKTVLTQLLATQQFGSSGLVIADTVTFSYYDAAPNKGRLHWRRTGNADGSITTTYTNYTTAGRSQEKTISAAGCAPRKEYFEYDNTNRFLTKVKNHLLHETQFLYALGTGNKTKAIDPNGLITNYIYDKFGRPTQVTYPDGTKTTAVLAWSSALPNAKYSTKITSDGKPELIVYYDVLGREICRKADGNFFKTIYNNKEEVVKTVHYLPAITSPETNGIVQEYAYDNYGRMNGRTAPYTNLSYTYQGRKINITDNLRQVSSWKDYDALGRMTHANDEGGTIYYLYEIIRGENNKLRHQATIVAIDATTVIKFDLWGNRLSVNEPNAGTIFSFYNGFNELIKQVDARGDTTKFEYDLLGRVIQKQFSDANITQTIGYIYDSANKGKGKLHKIKMNNVETETFSYDNLSRLAQHSKTIDSISYAMGYTYNAEGELKDLTYPDGFKVKYSYTDDGKLKEIRQTNDSLIYYVGDRNKYNLPKYCHYGNDVRTEYQYNPYRLLTHIQIGNKVKDGVVIGHDTAVRGPSVPLYKADSAILNYRYTYNNKGLMSSRSESLINQFESFQYDNLDRLTDVTSGQIGQAGILQTFSYSNNGNISATSQLGAYSYIVNNKPHAVRTITSNVISAKDCEVAYNFFNQPAQIKEGDYQLDLFYGTNQQRNKSLTYNIKNDSLENTHYYINKYFEIVIDSTTRNCHYIYGDNGVVAMHIKTIFKSGKEPKGLPPVPIDSTYYIHTDHLGSYCAITSQSKRVVQRNYFDPWGNFCSIYAPQDGKGIGLPPEEPQIEEKPTINFSLTNRGFTGHEHYTYFKIINMNGRLYDPVIGRFFSPDNFVQTPDFTQSFNRYSYALNNPLKYKDPMGQWYEDYDDDYDDRLGDDADGDPWRDHHQKSGVGDFHDSNDDPANDPPSPYDWDNDPNSMIDPFDYSDQEKPNYPDYPHNTPRRNDTRFNPRESKINTTLDNIKFGVSLETGMIIGAIKITIATEFPNDVLTATSLGNFARWTGFIGGGANAVISIFQMRYASTWYQATGHGLDAAMSIIGSLGPYGFGLSLYYNGVIKNYPEIQKSVNQQLIDRSNMMQKGFIPVGHPGFPFR
jgi:RHS repeat-associated protein